ncbi:MAG: SpoIID/LytB domain-containing protein [Cyanobacteria bacterium J06627_32]
MGRPVNKRVGRHLRLAACLSSGLMDVGLLASGTATTLGFGVSAIAPVSAQAQSLNLPTAQPTAQPATSPTAQPAARNPEIKVGIVQRFGDQKDDKLTLGSLAGDQLTVSFETSGQAQTVTTDRLQIDITMQPLPTPVLEEWVVLSTHRSFESAEDSAIRWQAAGINAEIAQPDAWQVWAKREDYNSPLVRRLLLENLHAEGYTRAFLDSRAVKEVPKVAFTANGFKYVRDAFTITSANRRIQLAEGNRQTFRDLYAGDMKIQPNAYGTYTLVNQVPVELYLRGVVPHEIGPGAPRSAIEAQAILARTYVLRNLRRFAIDSYEICADTQCQVYYGLADADPGSNAAIAATAGQVLTYNNELVDALYSSTTGGVTARFTDVWNGADRPYLTPVVDSLSPKWDLAARPLSDEANFRAFIALQNGFNEEEWPAFRWNRTASLKEMDEILKLYLKNRQHPLANYNQLLDISVVERAASGRVQKVTIETDQGSFDLVKDEAVKALVPPRSLLFYVEPVMEMPPATKPADNDSTGTSLGEPTITLADLAEGSNEEAGVSETPVEDSTSEASETEAEQTPDPILTGFRFIGGGFGHGVGMSQTGAYNLGEKGYSHQQILEFYYPGTVLQPISKAVTFWDGD